MMPEHDHFKDKAFAPDELSFGLGYVE